MARAEFDRSAAPGELPMARMLLLLQHSPVQEAAALRLINQLHDETSPNFHQWLTPDQFGARFGPSTADIQTVTAWLGRHGFQVAAATHGRHIIEFSGTAAQVEEAFHAPIHKFVVQGQEYWANVSDIQIPRALAPVVAGIVSLNNFEPKPKTRALRGVGRTPSTGDPSATGPAVTFPSGGCFGGRQCFALGPYDFATIYNILPLWNEHIDGSGQSIAIVGESNIHIQDVRDFRALFGLAPNDPEVILNGPDPGINDAEGEALGDVSWSGGVATNAKIKLVVSQQTLTTFGFALSALYIVDNNLAPVMSLSFLVCERFLGSSGNAFWYTLYQQAAAQGITVSVAAGDSGAAGCDPFFAPPPDPAQSGRAVNGVASTPFNVAMGGTDFSGNGHLSTYFRATSDPVTKASALSYIPEVPWDDTCVSPLLVPLGWSSNPNPLARCNDPATLSFFIGVLAAAGGPSGCTVSDGSNPASCRGGYAKPSWQTGIGVPRDGKRDIPDVSFFTGGDLGVFYIACDADFTGAASCDLNAPYQDFVATIGGTSIAAPEFAGVMALVNQKTNSRQGNANYVLYKLAAAQDPSNCNSSTSVASNCIFNDITQGTNRVSCAAGSPDCQLFGQSLPVGIVNGYDAGVGYDLASGLGTINVTNLVNAWTSTAFLPTNTALAISPTAITHGQNVLAKVAVKASGGVPSGAVSLITSDNQAVGAFVLDKDGTVSASTNALPGGNYRVFARYGGDGTFSPSDSDAVSVVVNPESSKTSPAIETFDPTGVITSQNAKTLPFGSFYVLNIDVTNNSGKTCINFNTQQQRSPCPSGIVALTDNGEPLNGGVLALNSEGHTEDDVVQFFAGVHHIGAVYNGDRSFEPSALVDNVVVTRAITTTSVSSSVANEHSIALTALISTQSNAIANAQQEPEGFLQFHDCGVPIASPVAVTGGFDPQSLFANGTAVLNITLGSGVHSITATYTGSSNYSGSTSAPTGIVVGGSGPSKGCH